MTKSKGNSWKGSRKWGKIGRAQKCKALTIAEFGNGREERTVADEIREERELFEEYMRVENAGGPLGDEGYEI